MGNSKSAGVVLVTGGAGYLGSHANKELTRRGYETLVLDNFVFGHPEFLKWGRHVEADLADTAALRRIFSENKIAAVMHFAAFTYVGESVTDPQKYYLNNFANTLNLLRVMLEHKVKTIIFSSTCATYGNPIEVPIPEGHPQHPVNPYGWAKLMVERVLDDYRAAYGLQYASLRYFNAAGADPEAEIGEWHRPETHLIPLVLDAALGTAPDIKIFGTDYPTPDGTCVRDYIHVTDLADAHVMALEYLMAGGQSENFNLGNGNGFSVREVIEECRRVTGVNIKATEIGRRPGDPPALVGSAGKIRATLGWRPLYASLPTIVSTAWMWHKRLHELTKKV